MTANGKYPVGDLDNLFSPNQLQLSLEPKTLSDSFNPFLEDASNFKHCEKKNIVIATLFRKLQTVEDLVRAHSKKQRFRTPLDNQHVKGFQPLVKSAWEHFHHVFLSLWENLTWKISLLVTSKILGMFRYTMAAKDKYYFQDLENFLSPTQI